MKAKLNAWVTEGTRNVYRMLVWEPKRTRALAIPWSARNSTMKHTLQLCSQVVVRRSFRRAYCLQLQDRKINQARHQQVGGRQMEAVRPSEMSVNFYQTTRRYIPEDSTLHSTVRTKYNIDLKEIKCAYMD